MIRNLLVCFFFTYPAFGQQVPPELQIITNNLLKGQYFFESFNDSKEIKEHNGFSSSTKLSEVKAGKPILEYVITGDVLRNASATTPVSKLIKTQDLWFIPLFENNKAVCFLEIAKFPSKWAVGQWSPVSLGRTPAAKAWQKIIDTWPPSSKCNPLYIEVPSSQKIFFHIPQQNDSNLTKIMPIINIKSGPLSKNASTSYSNLTSSNETITTLKNDLAKRIGGKGK